MIKFGDEICRTCDMAHMFICVDNCVKQEVCDEKDIASNSNGFAILQQRVNGTDGGNN